MFEVWCYSQHNAQVVVNSLSEDKAQVLAEEYPNMIYFFAELS